VSDFDKARIFSKDFRMIFEYHIMKSRPVEAESFYEDRRMDKRMDRQTDMTKLIVTSRNFADAPKKARLSKQL
jgi:hypothetical protein